MYYYIFAFIIIMVLYSLYSPELSSAYNNVARLLPRNYATRLKNYYGYHMI